LRVHQQFESSSAQWLGSWKELHQLQKINVSVDFGENDKTDSINFQADFLHSGQCGLSMGMESHVNLLLKKEETNKQKQLSPSQTHFIK
jgi:hypothetical protein